MATDKRTVGARLTTLESDVTTLKSDVAALKSNGETPVPVTDPVSQPPLNSGALDALAADVATLKANAPDPNVQAEKDAKQTERLARVESILSRVILALGGDVYGDTAKTDVEALGGTWTGSGV